MSGEPITPKLIPYRCKQCLQDISFTLSKEVLEKGVFPVQLESVHGTPPHKLTIQVAKNFEVVKFEITEERGEKAKSVSLNSLKEVLGGLGLEEKDIELYFHCTGLGPVTLGEMALMAGIPIQATDLIVKKFLQCGIFREIPGARQYYQALPPYAALLKQIESFQEYITKIKTNVPADVESIKDRVAEQLATQRGSMDQSLGKLFQQQNTFNVIASLQTQSSQLLDQQISNLDKQFDANVKNLNQQVGLLGDQLVTNMKVLEEQVKSMDKEMAKSTQLIDDQVKLLDAHLNNSSSLMDSQIDSLANQLKVIQQNIAENLDKLRLGVILQTVDDVIENTIDSEIKSIRDTFQEKFATPFRDILTRLKASFKEQVLVAFDDLNKKFKDVVQNQFQGYILQMNEKFKDTVENQFGNYVREMNANLKEFFQKKFGAPFRELLNRLDKTIMSTTHDAAVMGKDISTLFNSAINQLRTSFSESIVSKLDDTLANIQEKLKGSAATIKDFWDQAKQEIQLKMEDVWFIRTPEGLKAQINDALTRIKMRVLIVAPSLADIDMKPILDAPSSRNIRICCSINPKSDQKILDALKPHTNVTCRHRDRQNLWGINRDHEEIILGVVEKVKGSKIDWEVAGIGSILEEHIKILVPVLEEAWLNAKKLGEA